MGADVNSFVDTIIADAKEKVRTDLRNISSTVKKDFTDKAKEVVLLYYSHYSPRVYTRTDNLKDNVIDDSLSFSALNGNGYDAWIQFNSDNMSEYDIGHKEAVVSNFMEGIHGKPSIFVEKQSVLSLMDAFQVNYKTTLDGYFTNLGYTVK
jgi:hypothetical protein